MRSTAAPVEREAVENDDFEAVRLRSRDYSYPSQWNGIRAENNVATVEYKLMKAREAINQAACDLQPHQWHDFLVKLRAELTEQIAMLHIQQEIDPG